MKLRFMYVREGLHFFAFANDDERPKFAIFSVDAWASNFGFRLLRVKSMTHNIDDFFDRCLLGVSINHGRIIIDFAFLRLLVC